MKTIASQTRLRKKIAALSKPAGLSSKSGVNPLFKLAHISHFMDSKKIQFDRRITPRKAW
jgi:hypothetical protein